MTNDVELNDRRANYSASSGQTIFDIDFPILETSDITVYKNGVALVSGYTVDINDLTITLDTGATAGDIITIEGDTKPYRSTSYPLSGSLRSALLNGDIRKLLYIAQELGTKIGRSISLAQNESSGISQRLPKAETGKALVWGTDGLENLNVDLGNLDTVVAASEAAQMAAESAAASADADAVSAAASASIAQAAAAGIKWREPVKAATTGNKGLNSLSAIDGYTPSDGDRILVLYNTSTNSNGIYNAHAGVWTRATDADSWSELVSSAVLVEQGTVNHDKLFICTSDSGGTLGISAISWSELNLPISDGAISTAAKIVDGILTFAKMASTAIASLSDWANGTADKLLTAANFLPALLAAIGVSKYYESAEISLTTNTLTTLPHSFGKKPKEIWAVLICKTAEHGYAVDDEITMDNVIYTQAATQDYNNLLAYNATNLYLRTGNGGTSGSLIRHLTNGSIQAPTAANWRWIVRARA